MCLSDRQPIQLIWLPFIIIISSFSIRTIRTVRMSYRTKLSEKYNTSGGGSIVAFFSFHFGNAHVIMNNACIDNKQIYMAGDDNNNCNGNGITRIKMARSEKKPFTCKLSEIFATRSEMRTKNRDENIISLKFTFSLGDMCHETVLRKHNGFFLVLSHANTLDCSYFSSKKKTRELEGVPPII